MVWYGRVQKCEHSPNVAIRFICASESLNLAGATFDAIRCGFTDYHDQMTAFPEKSRPQEHVKREVAQQQHSPNKVAKHVMPGCCCMCALRTGSTLATDLGDRGDAPLDVPLQDDSTDGIADLPSDVNQHRVLHHACHTCALAAPPTHQHERKRRTKKREIEWPHVRAAHYTNTGRVFFF